MVTFWRIGRILDLLVSLPHLEQDLVEANSLDKPLKHKCPLVSCRGWWKGPAVSVAGFKPCIWLALYERQVEGDLMSTYRGGGKVRMDREI